MNIHLSILQITMVLLHLTNRYEIKRRNSIIERLNITEQLFAIYLFHCIALAEQRLSKCMHKTVRDLIAYDKSPGLEISFLNYFVIKFF
jgi:hypothetical protein